MQLTPEVLIARGLTQGRHSRPEPTPTNRERLMNYRSRVEPVLGNSHSWPWYRRGARQ